MKRFSIYLILAVILVSVSACTPLSDCFECSIQHRTFEWSAQQSNRDSSFTTYKEHCNVGRAVIDSFITSNSDTIVIDRYFDGATTPHPDKFIKTPHCVRIVKKK